MTSEKNDLNNNQNESNETNLNSDRKCNTESILKYKIKKDGPYEFVLDVVDGKLLIVDIFPGGIIERHG